MYNNTFTRARKIGRVGIGGRPSRRTRYRIREPVVLFLRRRPVNERMIRPASLSAAALLAGALALAACSPSAPPGDVAMKPKIKVECVDCNTPAVAPETPPATEEE